MIAIPLADHAQDTRMSYPAPAPQPGWYPDPSGAPGQRYFDGHQWTISAPPQPSIVINNFVAPTSGPNTALHLALTLFTCGMWLPVWLIIAVVAAVGSLYVLGRAMTDFRYFLGLMAVAGLGYLGYRAYERAVERRAENARLASHADAENRAFMSGDSSGLYGQYPPVQPPDLPG
jgi:hypothetical protein